MPSLKLMSYNVKGQEAVWRASHLRRIAEVIDEVKPDVVGLQELHRRGWRARFADQAAELARLTGLEMAFGQSFGKGDRQYGNALLARGRILDQHVHPLPGGGEPRTLLEVRVDLNGITITCFVTHLSAWGRFGRTNRLRQTEAVAAIVQSSQRPFVLTGDFNSEPTGEELRVFHDGDLVLSCFAPSVVTHRATKKCLDYLFVDDGWSVLKAEVLEKGPSDHWPIIATMQRTGN
jgi:endonuclease/exonuclease/phosphatase family metal-dependent hydrolase